VDGHHVLECSLQTGFQTASGSLFRFINVIRLRGVNTVPVTVLAREEVGGAVIGGHHPEIGPGSEVFWWIWFFGSELGDDRSLTETTVLDFVLGWKGWKWEYDIFD
jgi:hypothetical protein